MPTTNDQWAVATSWVGAETREAFDARFDRLGEDLDAAIEESLRQQLTSMTLNSPGRISVEDISVDYGANITSLEKTLNKFLMMGGTESTGPNVTKIVRPSFR